MLLVVKPSQLHPRRLLAPRPSNPQKLAEDLLDAADCGDASSVQALLAKGADANAKGALIMASQNGHRAVVEQLLAKGADVNAKGGGGTALGQASYKGHLEIVQAGSHSQ